ncbi:MAG: DUF1801 domain-containing protein [Bdellovibrionales bacterium]
MAENKTKPTGASVDDYINAIENEERRDDCRTLVKLMSIVTRQKPAMWGPSIVGFGAYHYKYESGREGDSCLTGFSSRKGDISVYLVVSGSDQANLLKQLGKHKMAKACLYIRRLRDVDLKILEQLVRNSVEEVKLRYAVTR